MDWDVYQHQSNAGDEKTSNQLQANEDRPISSEMTLHLPQLGKVSVKINLTDGRMLVNILAEQPETLDVLRAKRLSLAEAIGKNGQQLDALTVVRYE